MRQADLADEGDSMNRSATRSVSILPCLLATAVVAADSGRDHVLEGTVFIATRGSAPAKLALVSVSAVSVNGARARVRAEQEAAIAARELAISAADSLRAVLPEAKKAFDRAHQAWVVASTGAGDLSNAEKELVVAGRTLGEIEQRTRVGDLEPGVRWNMAVAFHAIAQDGVSPTADADGRFSLSIPGDDRYVIVAWGKWSVDCQTKTLRWFVPLTSDNLRAGHLELTKDNVCDDPSPEALLALLGDSR